MKKEEIEIIEKEIKDNLKAAECGLASNNEKFQWTKTANAMKKMLEENKKLKDRLELIETFYEENSLIKRIKIFYKYYKEKKKNANYRNDSKNDTSRNNTIYNNSNGNTWDNEIDKIFNN